MRNTKVPVLFVLLAVASASAWAAKLDPSTPEAPGVPNFHRLNEHVYRGAQPTEQGFVSLSKLGVQVVIDLRRDGEDHEHSLNREAELVKAAGMKYVSIPMKGIVAPTEEQVTQVLALFNSGETVFVHCRKGMDRTGTVIAAYRITHDRWNNDRALKEAESIGMSWTEVGMKRYIRKMERPAEQVADADPTPHQ